MSTSQKQVRVQVLLSVEDKSEAEMLTERYYGMQLSQFLKLITKLLIHEQFNTSIDISPIKKPSSNTVDTAP